MSALLPGLNMNNPCKGARDCARTESQASGSPQATRVRLIIHQTGNQRFANVFLFSD